jgi:hypothetical protein
VRTHRAGLLLTLAAATVVMLPGAAQAAPDNGPSTENTQPDRRNQLLGQGWRESADRLLVTNGDVTGLHLMVAEAKTGYGWRTVATLKQPGVEADQWIGNACLTGSGRRAVVVYAPRTFTNKARLARRGGYTAVVDLVSGAVRKLPVRTSLAYFNPGCGAGETAVLTQEGDEDLGRTRLLAVDAASGVLGRRIEVRGQLTSAVPARGGIVAAASGSVVRVSGDGRTTPVSAATGVPFQLHPDADDHIVFQQNDGRGTLVRRTGAVGSPATTLASGPTGEIGIRSGTGGRVFITGRPDKVAALPSTVRRLDLPSTAALSTLGEAAVTEVKPAGGRAGADPSAAQPVQLAVTSVKTGRQMTFTVNPAEALTPRWGETPDPDRVCAVPRNDPAYQVYQPKPKQVEWAVDMAVKGHLSIQRGANWNGNGIGAYVPQQMFPPVALRGGGQVPAQVMLGILGQESNLWQASRHVLPGETGNPLVGNYYGVDIYNDTEADDWDIDWAEADCGYGVSQMTDGMRLRGKERPGEVALPWEQQVAIGTDYAANVAAGLRLLQNKWNEIWDAGMRLNDGDPSRIENWFYAIWAYNSGFHQRGEAGSNGAWGLGWLNNPANPRYDPNRHNFGSDPHDFAHPQDWPYPEKVLGFASDPPSGFEAPNTEVPFFRAAWWNGADCGGGGADIPECALYNKRHAFPEKYRFCTADNNCEWGASHVPNAPEVVGEPAGPCAHRNSAGQYDLKCWVHSSAIWKGDCAFQCGHEFIRYDYPDFAGEPANGTSYPPACSRNGLGGLSAQTINDVPDATRPIRDPGCNAIGLNQGMLSFAFAKDAAGRESSKIDFHQVGGGYGAHYWFSHAYSDDALGRKLKVTGTWTFDTTVDGYAEVLVHMPHSGGEFAGNAEYNINTAYGPVTVYSGRNANANQWVSLGKYPFFGKPTVQLSNVTATGDGTKKIIWDAVAIQPMYESIASGYKGFWNRAADNCPVLHENSTAGGGVVEQRACTVWHINNWRFDNLSTDSDPNGPYRIVDRGSGLCMGVLGNSTAAGALVQVAACDSANTSQQWLKEEVRATDPNNTSVELIFNKRSGFCLRPVIGSTTPGRALEQASCAVDSNNMLTDMTEGWRVTELNPE